MTHLAIGEFLIVYEDGLVRFHDTASNSTHCLCPAEMNRLFELLDRVTWERRRALRIPVSQDDCLGAVLQIGDRVYSVTPIDISSTGIQIQWNNESPAVKLMDEVAVVLDFRGKLVTTVGRVRRVNGAMVGISFVEDSEEGDTGKNSGIEFIIDILERKWLEQRIFGRG